ncbi:hypothetical protein CROQUDRAFT_659657 [Cronartium quercuum f. sp. fusiforme G11]|uniref:Uncharacterized protein n=1 Tax=Cronartium quercuum f. sp. fusiforme G11 TaxID=708437 RepID=A0A9P6NIB8_9BASI|nr:hypothetical protein CROQUDRAFT_659657 [Cronartium quercuum f. sp. fusiforme G11]
MTTKAPTRNSTPQCVKSCARTKVEEGYCAMAEVFAGAYARCLRDNCGLEDAGKGLQIMDKICSGKAKKKPLSSGGDGNGRRPGHKAHKGLGHTGGSYGCDSSEIPQGQPTSTAPIEQSTGGTPGTPNPTEPSSLSVGSASPPQGKTGSLSNGDSDSSAGLLKPSAVSAIVALLALIFAFNL